MRHDLKKHIKKFLILIQDDDSDEESDPDSSVNGEKPSSRSQVSRKKSKSNKKIVSVNRNEIPEPSSRKLCKFF